MEDRQIIYYFVLFAAIAILAGALGRVPTVTVATARAEAETRLEDVPAGAWAALALDKALKWILGLIGGAVLSGIVLAVYREARGAWRTWKQSGYTRRWKAGPNANYQPPAPRQKDLSARDIATLALIGRGGEQPPRLPQARLVQGEDEPRLDIDLS